MTDRTDRPLRRPKGITCPACAVKLYTRRVVLLTGGTVRRVRSCRQCGHTCSTIERTSDSLSQK